MDKENDS